MNWTQFFAMGGYGFYVWSSYGLAAVILILNLYLPLHRRKTVRRLLREFVRLKRSSQPGSE
ncbi:MAG: heme exporter protein CcmD [Gammaproteobacteria bacterium]|nr:heme exporter protein CcmD [Gammaproteobacteria bacterium]